MVLSDALPCEVHDAEVALRVGVSLFSRQLKPLHRFVVILSDTVPDVVHQTEVALCVGVSLVSRKPIPLDRFAIVLGGSLPFLVHEAESVLRGSIAVFGTRTPNSHRSRVVASLIRSVTIFAKTASILDL